VTTEGKRGVEIMIDAHIHIFPPYRSVKAVRWLKRYIPGLQVSEMVNETEILRMLKDSGVSHFFNYIYPLRPEESQPLNEYNHQLSKRVKNAVCFGSLHPENRNRMEILEEALIDFGLIGIKFHPFVQKFSILNDHLDEVYRALEKMGRPLVLHTGFDRFYKAKIGAEDVETILLRYPDLIVVIAHMFYPRIDRAFHLLEKYENVFLDATNLLSDYQEPESGENIFEGKLEKEGKEGRYRIDCMLFRDKMERYSHRILFGSDYPVAMNDPEKIYRHVLSLSMSDAAKENILSGTAMSFIKRFKPNFFA